MKLRIILIAFILITISSVANASGNTSVGFNKFGRSVTINFAFHVGDDKSNDIITYHDNYVSSYDPAGIVLAIVFANSVFGTRVNSSYSSNDYLLEMRQPMSNNRFLIVFTKGNSQIIADKIHMINNGILARTFGSLTTTVPDSYPIFMRLEYTDIDLTSRVRWSPGARELLIINEGLSNRNKPQLSTELIK